MLLGSRRPLSARQNRQCIQRDARRKHTNGRRELRVEPLEIRALLSATMPGYAVPDHLGYVAPHGMAPMATSAPAGYTPAQIRSVYGFDKISFNGGAVAGDGAGTTIAIVDAYDDPRIQNDLHQFDAAFGLPDPVLTKVNQFGSATALPAADSGWATEIALDVEWAHAMAPKANILLVEAASSSMTDLTAAVDYARRAPGVVAVSMSWGGGEFYGETSYDGYFTTPAGHTGVTFVASSGDSGAPASYPSVSPNVVSVGGTTLYRNSGGGYGSETGWGGSGGGLSSYEAQPSYQKGIVSQSTTFRTNPDVAYDADPNTGFSVYDSYNNGTLYPWSQFGGTSAAAPQWAAVVAIADQGRVLAGKAALDGRTQTLPMLYALSAGDFHDVTGGTSTGQPRYSATAGYDLVTGRGSPYANLVVNDLVGSVSSTPASTVTHFSITGVPTNDTAGQTFSITVTALDASNNVVPSYVGAIHLGSSDGAAVLPGNYTFTSSNRGIYTFTGLTLKTAGSQTITVFDVSSGSVLGSATVLVRPAAAARLVFGQQPANTAPGSTISPAVTVRIVDQYNNLLASDSSDRVTIALGANPGGATLSGTTTATVSGGVASFGNLSINQPGSGYSLKAALGGMAVTSGSFKVTAATTAAVEGFEGGSTYYIMGAWSPTAYLSTAARHDGTYGLLDSPGTDWIYRNDAALQVKPGDTLSVWLNFAGAADGRAYFGFGSSAAGAYSVVAAPNTGQLLIQSNAGWGFSDLASVNQSYQPNHWYRLEVDWGTSGAIVGKLFDSNGTTLISSVTSPIAAIASGGIAFRTIGAYNKYWDTVQLTPGVNRFVSPAAAHSAFPPAGADAADLAAAATTSRYSFELARLFAATETWGSDARSQRRPGSSAILSDGEEAFSIASLDRQLVDGLFGLRSFRW